MLELLIVMVFLPRVSYVAKDFNGVPLYFRFVRHVIVTLTICIIPYIWLMISFSSSSDQALAQLHPPVKSTEHHTHETSSAHAAPTHLLRFQAWRRCSYCLAFALFLWH